MVLITMNVPLFPSLNVFDYYSFPQLLRDSQKGLAMSFKALNTVFLGM
jgi:hypothetical protein